ncbi:hypothetical protein D3C75_1208960 [compost metagenome]
MTLLRAAFGHCQRQVEQAAIDHRSHLRQWRVRFEMRAQRTQALIQGQVRRRWYRQITVIGRQSFAQPLLQLHEQRNHVNFFKSAQGNG